MLANFERQNFNRPTTPSRSRTKYLYDGWRSIQEVDYDIQTNLVARYVYGLRYLDEVVHMDRDADGDGDLYDDDSRGDPESYNVYFVIDGKPPCDPEKDPNCPPPDEE